MREQSSLSPYIATYLLTTHPGRRSSIAAAWSTILSHPSSTDKLTLISSPEEHYAASKTERRRRHSCSTSEEGRKSSLEGSGRRRRSSAWSRDTGTTAEHGSRWKRLFRRSVRREDEGKNEDVE